MDILNEQVKYSITTQMNIRYEGELVSINKEENNIVLKQVKSFGTEGRRPGNQIAPTSTVYELIQFKSPEIQQMIQILSSTPSRPVTQPEPQVKKQVQENLNKPPPGKLFEKSTQLQEIQSSGAHQNQNQTVVTQEQQYVAENFFDNIDSSVTNKKSETREDRNQQYHKDVDTFGKDDVTNQIRNDRMKKNNRNFYNNHQGGGRGYNNYRNNNRNNFNDLNRTHGGFENNNYGGGDNHPRPYKNYNNYNNNYNNNSNRNYNNYNEGQPHYNSYGRGRGRGGYRNDNIRDDYVPQYPQNTQGEGKN